MLQVHKRFQQKTWHIVPQFILSIQFADTKWFLDYDLESKTKIAMNI